MNHQEQIVLLSEQNLSVDEKKKREGLAKQIAVDAGKEIMTNDLIQYNINQPKFDNLTQEQAEKLDKLLWTFKQDSFIPHTIVGAPDFDSNPVQIGWSENQFRKAVAIVNLSETIPKSYLESKNIHEIIDDDEIKKYME